EDTPDIALFHAGLSVVSRTPGYPSARPEGCACQTARAGPVTRRSPHLTLAYAVFPARLRAPLRRRLPSSLVPRSSVQAAPRPFGSLGLCWPARSGGETIPAVRLEPADERALGHDPRRVDPALGLVVVPLDLAEVGRITEPRVLVEVTRVAP